MIDVGTGDGSQEPYIYISKKGESGAWLTLSHCWGKTATYVTNKYNLASGSRSLPYTDLPPTFKDAIKVTRLLGFRYLWIDSICILQGSDTEAQKDWLAESRRMRNYYKECVLCIAADDAPSDEEGFLNTRPEETRISVPFNQCRWENGKPCNIYLGAEISHWSSRLGCCPILSSRGWTLQEEVLSPRTLHYTSKQLVWDCQRQTAYESNLNPEEWPMNSNLEDYPKRYLLVPDFAKEMMSNLSSPSYLSPLDPATRWYSLVNNYSKRHLTYPGDRLHALQGLAEEIHSQSGFTYWAGIWAEDAHRGLLWHMYGVGKTPKSQIAPSWSWAALDFESQHPGRHNPHNSLYGPDIVIDESEFKAELIACDIVTANARSGYITLRSLWLDLEQWVGGESALLQIDQSQWYEWRRQGGVEESSSMSGTSDSESLDPDSENTKLVNPDPEAPNLQDLHLVHSDTEEAHSKEADSQETDSEEAYCEGVESEEPDPEDAQSEEADSEQADSQELESISSNSSDSHPAHSDSEESNTRNPDAGTSRCEYHRYLKPKFEKGQLLVNLDQVSEILRTTEASKLGLLQIATGHFEYPNVSIIFCLLLEPGTQEGTFRSIGMVQVPNIEGFTLRPWEIRSVSIF